MKLFFTILLLSLSCSAQSLLPVAGDKAPEFELRQLLQAPAGTPVSLAALRGKAIVLEFWATWCGGCVAAIPHLNELAEHFKDKPVVFLSLTDEDQSIVEAFLKKRPMSGWVGIDKDELTFTRFGIQGRPQTYLIDANGIVQARALPAALDAAVIDHLIAGEPIPDSEKLNRPVVAPLEQLQGAPPPMVQILVRPAVSKSVSGFSPGARWRGEGGRIEYYGVTLRALLEYEEDLDKAFIIAPDWFDGTRYDISTVVPHGMDDIRHSLLKQVLAATFQMETRRETRPASGYVLRRDLGAQGKLTASSAKGTLGHARAGHFTGVATSISRLASLLYADFNEVEVVDETGLTGNYDFDLDWKQGDAESLKAALRDQLGLSLTKETRNREVLVVVSATEPKTW